MAESNKKGLKSSDFLMAVCAVVVILMIIIPLPTVLLDLLMACNLLFAVLILIQVIYAPRAVDLSSFPTILQFITVFGLGLNVSSTRLILSKGIDFDGKMVNAFAKFVVGSGGTEGVLIGFVIFIIIIAVQTFVLTKGATRVAEVAARFTLDAMPMKQASVEAEYNSGAITEEEARKKKLELQIESDFYGAMDGASKFVSGNVKVGIFITVINLVVGLIFGMVLRHEDFTSSIGIYASLTIGDGLLSQVPSLIVSFATGLIVARSASDGNTTIGENISKQFSQSAMIYYISGGIMVVLGLLPGFPWYILFPMAAMLLIAGYRISSSIKKRVDIKKLSENKKAQDSALTKKVDNIAAPLESLSLELGFALIPLVDKDKGAELLGRITKMRSEIMSDLGLSVPSIRIVDNMRLKDSEYSFKIKGAEVGRSKIRMNSFMCMNTGAVIKELPGEPTTDPTFNLPAIWITQDRREEAERAGYAIVDPPTILATHLTDLIRKYAAEILGREEVHKLIEEIRKDYPTVVEETTKLFNVGEIQKVLQGLLREQVSIRNLVDIFETMADYGPVTKKADILVEKVRQALGRTICLQYADEDTHILKVFTVEQPFLARLVESRVDTMNGPITTLSLDEQRKWITAVNNTIAETASQGDMPIILCPQDARILIKESTSREFPKLVVLAMEEIVPEIKVEMIGVINVGL